VVGPQAGAAQVVVASNRGPLSYSVADDGTLEARRGGGGLISGLAGVADAVWVCAALTEGDRMAARAADGRLGVAEGTRAQIRMLSIDPITFARAYNDVANSTLWFVHHLLFDTAQRPVFDDRWDREWTSYVEYNAAFADALAEEAAEGGRVLVQDYHLTLVPHLLRQRRPDLRIGHFSHTPWAPPDYYRVLPDDVAVAVLEGVLGADAAGFLTPRWADAFMNCCEQTLGARVDRAAATVDHRGRTTRVTVHPLGVDGDELRARAAQPDVQIRLATLREQVGDRLALVRIDRTELSKNIVRGLEAYRLMLRTHPEWRGRVVHVAFAYPSRHDLPVYREYTAAVQRVANEIIDEFGTPEWSPLLLHVQDDLARSLAAYVLADVLLVNPLRDGMNLVAKEAPVLSERGCALVLSREAGAAVELGGDALLVNPFDVSETARALHDALSLTMEQRQSRGLALAARATALTPRRWLADQLADLRVGAAG